MVKPFSCAETSAHYIIVDAKGEALCTMATRKCNHWCSLLDCRILGLQYCNHKSIRGDWREQSLRRISASNQGLLNRHRRMKRLGLVTPNAGYVTGLHVCNLDTSTVNP